MDDEFFDQYESPPRGWRRRDWWGPGIRTAKVFAKICKLHPEERETKAKELEQAKKWDALSDYQTIYGKTKQKREERRRQKKEYFHYRRKQLVAKGSTEATELRLDFEYYFERAIERMSRKYQLAFKEVMHATYWRSMKMNEAIAKYWVDKGIGCERSFYNQLRSFENRFKEVFNADVS